MELYIIRHGKTIWNAEKRLQGRTDIELNQEGKEKAVTLGKKLKDIPFDLIYSAASRCGTCTHTQTHTHTHAHIHTHMHTYHRTMV